MYPKLAPILRCILAGLYFFMVFMLASYVVLSGYHVSACPSFGSGMGDAFVMYLIFLASMPGAMGAMPETMVLVSILMPGMLLFIWLALFTRLRRWGAVKTGLLGIVWLLGLFITAYLYAWLTNVHLRCGGFGF
jgi:hypothetical protein